MAFTARATLLFCISLLFQRISGQVTTFSTPHALSESSLWTAPTGCTVARAVINGAGGGRGGSTGMRGGAGAKVTVTFAVTGGVTAVRAYVGGGGGGATGTACGAGGSASAITVDGILLAVAGGGGGGCTTGSGTLSCPAGGGAGGTPVGTRTCSGGFGGTLTAAGAANGNGAAGTGPALVQGGGAGGRGCTTCTVAGTLGAMGWSAGGPGTVKLSTYGGAGGGGGYYSGGGGGAASFGTTGGGGSSWNSSAALTAAYVTGVDGGGGVCGGTTGCPGAVTLECIVPAPASSTPTVTPSPTPSATIGGAPASSTSSSTPSPTPSPTLTPTASRSTGAAVVTSPTSMPSITRCTSSTVSPRPTTRQATRTVTKSLSFTRSVSRTVTKSPLPTTRIATRTVTRSTSRTLSQSQQASTRVRTRSMCPSSTPTVSLTRSITKTQAASSRPPTVSRCNSGSPTPRATTRARTVSMSVTVTRSVSQSRTLSVAPTRPPMACTATAGYYCMPATLVVAPCPAGVFGAVSGLTTPACSGNCTAAPGYFCPPGSTAPTATIICPVGAYCGGGGAGNVSCYPVTACTVAGLSAQPPCYWNVSTLAGSGVAGWADGQATVAKFNAPNGVVFDPISLGVFVGDHLNNRVRSISPVGLVTTFVGSGSPAFVDGVGTLAALSGPAAVSLDTLGNMFVADITNNRIRKVFLSSGSMTTLAGSGAAGSANGVGIAAQIHNPSDIAVDASGAVGYVVAQGGSTIRAIDLTTKAVSTLAGSGIAGFADGVGTAARFDLPGCAVWHPSGVLFVTDGWGGCVGCGNHRIRSVAISTAQVTTFAGNGVAGGANGLGTSATFNQPHGIALSATTSILFIAEFSGGRVRSIDISTALVQTIAGTGNAGFGNGFGVLSVFNGPLYLTSSPSGVLFTADSGNNRIRQLTCMPCPTSYYCASGAPVICPSGSYCPLSSINPTLCPAGTYGATTGLATPACSGPCTAAPGYFCPPGSTSPTASLICPVGAFCGGGSAANVSCSLVTACSVTGLSAQPPCYWNVSTLAGSGVTSSVNGVGTTASFNNPYGLDSFGSGLVVSEQSTSACIRTVSLSSAQVVTVAGLCGTPGLLDGSAATARFSTALSGVAALNSTFFAIADKGNFKVRLLKGGTVTSVPSLLSEPCGVFFINPSFLLVTDTGGSRILLVNLPTGSTAAVYGNGIATFADGPSATASFSQPISSVFNDKRIYVADWMNHRVRVIDTVVSVVTTLAGNGLTSVLNQPAGIAFFDAQTLVVTEFANHRITLVTIADGKLAYIAGATANSFADGFGLSARFNGPLGVAMESSVIYVTDRDNNRIRRLSCVPCPASFYCFSGAPVICPAGSYCPFSSVNATLSPPGTYTPSPGSSFPTPCFPGTYNPLPGQASCLQCEPGYFCPSNSTTMNPCGVNNYCPRGSSSPTPCPAFLAVDAILGPANGPAYDVDTAACLGHCYSGGPGQTSSCG